MIVEYDIEGGRACGVVTHDNGKSIRVWYRGTVITRHKEKHRICEAPVMQWDCFYYVEPTMPKALRDLEKAADRGKRRAGRKRRQLKK